MRGLYFLGDRQTEIREVPNPIPGPGQVVVAMEAAAICGSDLHLYRLHPKGRNAGSLRFIKGHEPCGVVAEIAPDVRRIRPGQRVVVYHYSGCGQCEHCASGDVFYCRDRMAYGLHADGSMADFILADEGNCLPLPDELSMVDGMLISCIAGTAYSSTKRLNLSGRDTLFVNGLGPLGLVMALFGRACGARVFGADIREERLALARAIGIDLALDATRVEIPQAIAEVTRGRGASAAFDSTGSPAANEVSLRSVGLYGRIVLTGISYREGTDGIDLNRPDVFLEKQLMLTSTIIFPKHMYWEIVRFIGDHEIPLASIVTHRFPLAEGMIALELADSGRCGKVMFEW